jgi:hypothetical protein
MKIPCSVTKKINKLKRTKNQKLCHMPYPMQNTIKTKIGA